MFNTSVTATTNFTDSCQKFVKILKREDVMCCWKARKLFEQSSASKIVNAENSATFSTACPTQGDRGLEPVPASLG